MVEGGTDEVEGISGQGNGTFLDNPASSGTKSHTYSRLHEDDEEGEEVASQLGQVQALPSSRYRP